MTKCECEQRQSQLRQIEIGSEWAENLPVLGFKNMFRYGKNESETFISFYENLL